ncbi:MAG: sigma-70 family RNA polymerase sigma factor [Flavobacteriales bacterium]|nr:sigma-70 family RNA polymerase sigma factor [Flavobacteriales bacterium]
MAKHQLHPEQWIDVFSDLLLNYALIRIKEREIAKDLVQETFLTTIRTKEQYRGEISEMNWLFLILKSRILDHYKKKKEVLESQLKGADDDEDSDDFFNSTGHWSKNGAPNEWTTDKMVRSAEFMHVLNECKNRLNEVQNAVFTMKYIDGEDSEMICKELNISSSNYWVLVHRAKLKLRECLEKNWMT